MTYRSKSLFNGLLAASGLLILGGCGTATAIVADAQGQSAISGLSMGCKKPYALTQDCSGFSGATRLVRVADFEYKIAGSENGDIILMMGAKPTADAWSGRSAEVANIAYEVTKKTLLDEGIRITQVQPVSTASVLNGYVITADGDAYSVLRAFSVNDE